MSAAKVHYHVQSGMCGGYLPNYEARCETLADARIDLAWQRDRIDETFEDVDGANVTRAGSLRKNFYLWDRGGDPYYVGYYARIDACTDPDCPTDPEW